MTFYSSNSEVAFVFASLTEFINCWQSKQSASFSVECKDGKASVNFSCDLGLPGGKHVKTSSKKKAPSSKLNASVHLICKISKKQKCCCHKNNYGDGIYIYIGERICVSFKF